MIYLHIYQLESSVKKQSKEILLHHLSHYLNRSIALENIRHNENGKPEIKGIDFSVSHSKNKLIQAFSTKSPIGIDIEHINKKRNYLALAKRYFHLSEVQLLKNQTPQDSALLFYSLWSRKEAVCKAQGGRLWYYLRDNYLNKKQLMATTVKGFNLAQFDLISDFSLVIASKETDENIKIIHE